MECLTKLNQFNDFFTTSQENQEILKIVFAENNETTDIMPEEENCHGESQFSELPAERNFSFDIEKHQNDDIQQAMQVENQRMRRKFNRFDCHLCEEQMSTNLKLIQHFNKNHPSAEIRYSCFLCPTFVKKYRSYTRHIQSHSNKRFTCDLCQKSFSQKITLIQHLNSHSKIKPYRCEDCGLNFKQNSSLFKHRKQKHLNEKPSCSECQKSFVNKDTLLQHMKSKHMMKKELSCSQCSKTFASRPAMNYHITSQHHKNENTNSNENRVSKALSEDSRILDNL